LEKDIDLAGYDWAPMGWSSGSSLRYPFHGIILGNHHTISNLHISSDNTDAGLIGWEIYSSIQALKITNASVKGRIGTGILTGESSYGIYRDCHVAGTVNGEKAGSMIGVDCSLGKINCTADVKVNGDIFEYLSYSDKEKSKIIIHDYITITNDNFRVKKPQVTEYSTKVWMIYQDGCLIVREDAEDDLELESYISDPGNYEVCLATLVSNYYVPISNKIKIIIE
jgi:hypothetical protein